MKLYDLKLGIIRGILVEHTIAIVTVKNAFQLVTQLVAQRRSLSWLSHCKRKKDRCELYRCGESASDTRYFFILFGVPKEIAGDTIGSFYQQGGWLPIML